jgi:hypothetical protein
MVKPFVVARDHVLAPIRTGYAGLREVRAALSVDENNTRLRMNCCAEKNGDRNREQNPSHHLLVPPDEQRFTSTMMPYVFSTS